MLKYKLMRDLQNRVRSLYGDKDYPMLVDIFIRDGYWWVELCDYGLIRSTDLLNPHHEVHNG